MQLSERELDMLNKFRQQQDSNCVSRTLMVLIGLMCVSAFALSMWIAIRNADLVMLLLGMVYACFSIVTLSAVRTLWDGNPQIVLLLKVVDHLIDVPTEVSGKSNDSME
ncbi:MAG: hypothetical protein ACKVHE_23530 [Planctomycetales bacterium]|jgi:hypothetical protein